MTLFLTISPIFADIFQFQSLPAVGEHEAFLKHLERLTRPLANVILVSSAEDIDLEA